MLDKLLDNRNPFCTYYNSGEEDSRNIKFYGTPVTPPNPPTAFTFTFYESLMMSPFTWGQNDVQALFGIQHLDLTLNFEPLVRILSGSLNGWLQAGAGIFDGGNIDNIAVTPVNNGAYLHLTFLTPPSDWSIPRLLHYPFYSINKTVAQTSAAIAPQGSATITTNAQIRHEISKRLYLIISPQVNWGDNTSMITTPNFFGSITNITMSFDNQDDRLASYQPFDLWQIACKNGLKSSWLEWSQILGAPMCLEFATDLNINPLLCPGVRGNFSYQSHCYIYDVREPVAGYS